MTQNRLPGDERDNKTRAKSSTQKRILTPEGASEFLQVPVKTLLNEWRALKLPGFFFGKHLRFSVKALEEWALKKSKESEEVKL